MIQTQTIFPKIIKIKFDDYLIALKTDSDPDIWTCYINPKYSNYLKKKTQSPDYKEEDINEGILAIIGDEGQLDIDLSNSSACGYKVIDKLLEKTPNLNKIHTAWLKESDNLKQLNLDLMRGILLKDAIFKTFTGRNLKRHGFNSLEIYDEQKTGKTYEQIEIYFYSNQNSSISSSPLK